MKGIFVEADLVGSLISDHAHSRSIANFMKRYKFHSRVAFSKVRTCFGQRALKFACWRGEHILVTDSFLDASIGIF
jgi:hypothetical protein